MVVLLHGVAGGWDELAIAVAALAVLWVAVKLAGRNSAGDDQDEEEEPEVAARPEERLNPAPSSLPSNLK